jgi:tetratricopeptide (TPR) repeat protein
LILPDGGAVANAETPPAVPPKRRVHGLALALAGLVLIGAVAVFMPRRPKRPPSPPPLFSNPAPLLALQEEARRRPEDAPLQARLGQAYLERGHYLSATEPLGEALRLGGDEVAVRCDLARCFLALRQPEEALRELALAVEQAPRDLALRIELSEAHARLQQRAPALAALDSFPRDDAGYPVSSEPGGSLAAAERMATAYARLEGWKQGLALARLLLADAGRTVASCVLAGKALLGLGRSKEAGEYLRQALRLRPADPDVAALCAQAALTAREPDAVVQPLLELASTSDNAPLWVRLELGRSLQRQGRWERAAEVFQKACDSAEDPAPAQLGASESLARSGHRDEAAYYRGLYLESLGRHREAADAYRALLALHPDLLASYSHLSRALAKAGDVDGALAVLKKAQSRVGESPEQQRMLLAELAAAYAAASQIEAAERTWQRYVESDPENADVGYQALGKMAEKVGRLDEAERLYRRCVELHPEADLYHLHLALVLLARRSDPGKLAQAIAELERTIALAPASPDAFEQLGLAYQAAGRTELAVAALRHAVDLDPTDPATYGNLARPLTALGKREAATRALALYKRYRAERQEMDALQLRAKLAPNDPAVLGRLAAVCEKAGLLSEVQKNLARVNALRPQDAAAREKLRTVRLRLGWEVPRPARSL